MSASLFPQHIIARKRDGHVLSQAEIAAFVRGATDGSWVDYQLSAMLMAIFVRGMSTAETVVLTDAMMKSGVVADLSSVRAPKVDKHSTGGVGDKVSIHLSPMIAACGVAVPMISGRGLGHTGGTLDKLESIPGFRVGLSMEEYRAQVAKIGCALIGQTKELAPADKKLYALRDVTATVESLPLICASIMCKKLAEGIDALVLDVKFGAGAFMKDKAKARELAQVMVDIGNAMGKPTRALLTAMDQPLGRAVGNALEVAESIACLRGEGPRDLMDVTYALGEQMLLLAGTVKTAAEARLRLEKSISSSAALAKFREIVTAQGGDGRVVDDPSRLPQARLRIEVKSATGGYVQAVGAMEIALAALKLGAGRMKAEDTVDTTVGFNALVKIGERVPPGGVIAVVHASSDAALVAARESVVQAVRFCTEPVSAPRLVDEVIG